VATSAVGWHNDDSNALEPFLSRSLMNISRAHIPSGDRKCKDTTGPQHPSTRRKKSTGTYLCPHCNLRCDRRCDLTKHIKGAHDSPAQRPYGCRQCAARFLYLKDLRRHELHVHMSQALPNVQAGDLVREINAPNKARGTANSTTAGADVTRAST